MDRYTERFFNFMPNGGIRRLQRHGLKADFTTTGSMDYPGKQTEMESDYNGWGALTKDESRGSPTSPMTTSEIPSG